MSSLKERLKSNPKLKKLALWSIQPTRRPRPRLWIKWFVNPFVHKRKKGSYISRYTRLDVFPYKKFELGIQSVIEDFAVINNGCGDIIIGDRVRIGIGSAILGPVEFGNGAGTGQHVFISGFNHVYEDGLRNSSDQDVNIKKVVVEDEAHIGANSVVVAGVTIGKRCQIGAGSVVTKDVPSYTVAVGNPAKVIKQYDFTAQKWVTV